MATKLNQVVAVEKTVKEAVNKQTAPLFHSAKNGSLFAGLSRTYESIEDGGEELPPESTNVQFTVNDILDAFAKATTKLLDVQLTKETGNTDASADIVIGDVTIAEKVPVTFLLQFEKQLVQEVRGLLVSLPVLDPAQTWEPSATGKVGVSETEVVKRHRTKKVQRPIVLYPATPEHAAQTQLISEDMLAGYWSEKKFSGAITAQRKQELIEKVDKLIVAVKFARESANNKTVADKTIGADVFNYLFA